MKFSDSLLYLQIEKLLADMLNPGTGVPVGTHKAFLKDIPYAFTGYDLIEWMLERFEIEDSEALHLANSICKLGYIFPVNDIKNLTVKDDSTLYRFQTSFFWLSHNLNNEDTDYAIYLVKRTLDTSKESSPLEPYEEEQLEKLQLKLGDKWEFVCLQAEQQNKLAKERRKNDKIVLDSQEKAFWRIHRPPSNSFNPLETAPILNAHPSNRSRKKTIEYLSEEIDDLKSAFTRCRWKTSDVAKSYVSRWDNYYEFDPFIVKTEPSNPWISDDNSLWSQNPNVLTPKRLKLWSLNFKELLKDEQGFQQFLEFLRKEYSSENIRFWQACQDFKKCPTSKRQDAINRIYKEFLAPNAPKEINIDSYSRELVNKGVRDHSRYALDLAQDHIYTLMKKDSYVRFLRSDLYKNLFMAAQNSSKKKMILGFNFAPFMNLHHGITGTGAVGTIGAGTGPGAHSPSISGTGFRKCESVSSHLNILDSGSFSDNARDSVPTGTVNHGLVPVTGQVVINQSASNMVHSSSTGDINNSTVDPTCTTGSEGESERDKMLKRLQALGYDPVYTGGGAAATSTGGHHKARAGGSNAKRERVRDKEEDGDGKEKGVVTKERRSTLTSPEALESSLIMKLPKDLIEKEITSPVNTSHRPKPRASKAPTSKDLSTARTKPSKDDEIIELTLRSPGKNSKSSSGKSDQIGDKPKQQTSSKHGSEVVKVNGSKEISPNLTDICPWEDDDEVKRIIANKKGQEGNASATPSDKASKSRPSVEEICPWDNPEEVERILADQKQKQGVKVDSSNTSPTSATSKSPRNSANEICPWENQEETLMSKEFDHQRISLKSKPSLNKGVTEDSAKTQSNEDVCPWENEEEIQSFENKKKFSGTPPVPIEVITMKPKPKLISGPRSQTSSRDSHDSPIHNKGPDKSNQPPLSKPSETRIRDNSTPAAATNHKKSAPAKPTIEIKAQSDKSKAPPPPTLLAKASSSPTSATSASTTTNNKGPSSLPITNPSDKLVSTGSTTNGPPSPTTITNSTVPINVNKHPNQRKTVVVKQQPSVPLLPPTKLQWGESTQL